MYMYNVLFYFIFQDWVKENIFQNWFLFASVKTYCHSCEVT